MNDAANMGSLLAKMTAQTGETKQLNDNQVRAMIEMVVPKLLMEFPLMPQGMKCEFIEAGEKSWTLKITRP
ncbi:hypothetical protein [Mycobacterium phage WXIN]|nr:hypothetical protein [Mycobacterium phage WXIN]